MTRAWQPLTSEAGFTLAELLLGCAIAGLAMAGLVAIQQQGQFAYLMGSSRIETQQNARVALDLMTRELRTASAVTAMTSATDVSFAWKDAADVQHGIRYQLSGTDLTRSDDQVDGGRPMTLIGGVQALTMTYQYYNAATGAYETPNQVNPPTVSPCTYPACKPVTAIKISVTTKTEGNAAAQSAGDQRAVLESTVMLRLALS
jgi:Tfp pilus assembly protein PilW